jgi:hypothetical protein
MMEKTVALAKCFAYRSDSAPTHDSGGSGNTNHLVGVDVD